MPLYFEDADLRLVRPTGPARAHVVRLLRGCSYFERAARARVSTRHLEGFWARSPASLRDGGFRSALIYHRAADGGCDGE